MTLVSVWARVLSTASDCERFATLFEIGMSALSAIVAAIFVAISWSTVASVFVVAALALLPDDGLTLATASPRDGG